MAPKLVRGQRLLPLAGIQGLQNARPRLAFALSLLLELSRLPGPPLSARIASVQSGRCAGKAADPGRFLPTSDRGGAELYRKPRRQNAGPAQRPDRPAP